MKPKHVVSFLLLLLIALIVEESKSDVSHFFAPELSFFHGHPGHTFPFQIAFQPTVQQDQGLYAAPPPVQAGYPVSTHSPVAPTTTTTTEFTLPEIVENRNAKEHNFIPIRNQYLPPELERPNYESPKPPPTNQQGYQYARPTTTTTTTERPSPIIVLDPPELIPPLNMEEIIVQPPIQVGPGYDYNAPTPVNIALPPSTPAPAYLPPRDVITFETPVGAENSQIPLRVQVKEMRCLQQQQQQRQHDTVGFFRTVLKVESFIAATPTVDSDSNDKRCELKLSRSYVLVDIAEEDFQKCGVRKCGKDLCLRLRFPAIRGMRTSADAIMTLHCKTQDRIAVKTHALKIGVANDAQARNTGTYAHGGSQNTFRTHIELLRKSNNGFTQHLPANGAVQLGEDLLLRAHVLTGDGWNYTKLSDVSLQRIAPSGELLNLANLITTNGCVNPSMQSICTQPPVYDPPLGHKLAFKAVMFQGMRSGDEVVMTMRIHGCLEQHDCYISTQECSVNNLGRRKRNTDDLERKATMDNDTEISEISTIAFRVLMPNMNATTVIDDEKKEDQEHMKNFQIINLIGSLGFVALLTCLGIYAALRLRK
ncbi:uncharacterized protein LOC119673955 [Teleopsis dalmanni]|uniref:uncharacterized protein LOC119673955 n=1 Tax=Teleopsis dalmanni TaxID=139649 RepID=UPI0018CF1268|nr:uncharacterized protein LOC119673955 [Teleopsis dalmanni]